MCPSMTPERCVARVNLGRSGHPPPQGAASCVAHAQSQEWQPQCAGSCAPAHNHQTDFGTRCLRAMLDRRFYAAGLLKSEEAQWQLCIDQRSSSAHLLNSCWCCGEVAKQLAGGAKPGSTNCTCTEATVVIRHNSHQLQT